MINKAKFKALFSFTSALVHSILSTLIIVYELCLWVCFLNFLQLSVAVFFGMCH